MSRNYSVKEDPTLADQSLIWDVSNSDWRLTTLSAIKSLFSLVATDTVQAITAVWTFIAGIGFTSGRVAFKEFTSGTLTTGWNKIAQTTANAADSMSSMFRVTGTDGTFLIEVGFRDSSASKTHQNTTIKILSRSSIAAVDTYISGFRIGKSDSVDGAGAVLEVNILIGSEVTVQKISNSGKTSLLSSWNLFATPAISTGFCADGVSTATFLEAGEELSFAETGDNFLPAVTAKKVTTDSIIVSLLWDEIPKQGTGLTITVGGTLYVGNSVGTLTAFGTHTISNYSQVGKHASFFVNQTNIGASYGGNDPLSLIKVAGAITFTIT